MTDFGSSILLRGESKHEEAVGTIEFMAYGEGNTFESDTFSFGVTMYEVLYLHDRNGTGIHMYRKKPKFHFWFQDNLQFDFPLHWSKVWILPYDLAATEETQDNNDNGKPRDNSKPKNKFLNPPRFGAYSHMGTVLISTLGGASGKEPKGNYPQQAYAFLKKQVQGINELILDCVARNPKDRPSFDQISDRLNENIRKMALRNEFFREFWAQHWPTSPSVGWFDFFSKLERCCGTSFMKGQTWYPVNLGQDQNQYSFMLQVLLEITNSPTDDHLSYKTVDIERFGYFVDTIGWQSPPVTEIEEGLAFTTPFVTQDYEAEPEELAKIIEESPVGPFLKDRKICWIVYSEFNQRKKIKVSMDSIQGAITELFNLTDSNSVINFSTC